MKNIIIIAVLCFNIAYLACSDNPQPTTSFTPSEIKILRNEELTRQISVINKTIETITKMSVFLKTLQPNTVEAQDAMEQLKHFRILQEKHLIEAQTEQSLLNNGILRNPISKKENPHQVHWDDQRVV